MTDLEQVQIQIETAEKIRKLRDNCVKLMDNIYFKDVIEEAYFKEEAARLTSLIFLICYLNPLED